LKYHELQSAQLTHLPCSTYSWAFFAFCTSSTKQHFAK